MNVSLWRAAAACAVSVLAVLPVASSASGDTHHPQRRQLAVTALSNFKVVLTATRDPGQELNATVTAAGYQQTPAGWKLIATKQIGAASQWSWYATEVCGLTVTQLKPLPSSVEESDTITVSLLWGPAIGCLGPYTRTWRPVTAAAFGAGSAAPYLMRPRAGGAAISSALPSGPDGSA